MKNQLTQKVNYISLTKKNKYIAENPSNFNEEGIALLRKVLKPDDLSGFIDPLYDIAQFSGECYVICLIYLNRIFVFN